jgi:hypothetical protein
LGARLFRELSIVLATALVIEPLISLAVQPRCLVVVLRDTSITTM